MVLKIRYFDDFKLNKTILFSADQESLRLFIDTIRSLVTRGRAIKLTKLPYVRTYDQIEFTVTVSSVNAGLRQTEKDFFLELNVGGWTYVIDLLKEMLSSKSGEGHQYIEYGDSQYSETDLLISLNEYHEDGWIGWEM